MISPPLIWSSSAKRHVRSRILSTIMFSRTLQSSASSVRQLSTSSFPDVFIAGAARTPIGSFNGSLKAVSAPALGVAAMKKAMEQASIQADQVEEAYFGKYMRICADCCQSQKCMHRQCALSKHGSGTRSSSCPGRRLPGINGGHDHQQSMQFRHEGDHAGSTEPANRAEADHGGWRDGEHVQYPVRILSGAFA